MRVLNLMRAALDLEPALVWEREVSIGTAHLRIVYKADFRRLLFTLRLAADERTLIWTLYVKFGKIKRRLELTQRTDATDEKERRDGGVQTDMTEYRLVRLCRYGKPGTTGRLLLTLLIN